jgi:hypothetical protein
MGTAISVIRVDGTTGTRFFVVTVLITGFGEKQSEITGFCILGRVRRNFV